VFTSFSGLLRKLLRRNGSKEPTRTKLVLDLPAIIDLFGKEKVIDTIGLGKVVETAGLDKLVQTVGRERILATIFPNLTREQIKK